jgi:hypothetical protein
LNGSGRPGGKFDEATGSCPSEKTPNAYTWSMRAIRTALASTDHLSY